MDRELESNMSIKYTVNYRSIKYPRLEFKTGTLRLILPKGYKKEKDLLEKHQKWIIHKQETIPLALKQSKIRKLNENRTTEQLKALVADLAKQFQEELRTRISEVIFRKMKTKWASHSRNNNLTANTLLRFLPDNLVAYVTYHELAHAKQGRKHDRSFWRLVGKRFENHEMLENELLTYWFLIQRSRSYKCLKSSTSSGCSV